MSATNVHLEHGLLGTTRRTSPLVEVGLVPRHVVMLLVYLSQRSVDRRQTGKEKDGEASRMEE